MTQPRLIMTLLVRNEADIVARNVAWHLSQGVDHVIATDNGSTDGTTDALRAFERDGKLTLLHEPSDAYLQDVWTTRMALMARDDHGADWVLCNDADEFWRAPSGDLRDVLPDTDNGPAMLICQRHNFIAPRDALATGDWASTLVYRAVAPPAPPRGPQKPADLHAIALEHSYFQYRLPPKMLFRTRGLRTIARGAHGGTYDEDTPLKTACPVETFHYPVRSRDEFESSVRRIGAALRRQPNVSVQTSWKYRRWLEMTERAGSIWPAFAEALPDRATLQTDLDAGRMVRDLSMDRALRSLDVPPPLPADRRRPVQRPTVPCDAGRLVVVTGPDDATDRAVAELLISRGSTPPLSPGLEALHAAALVETGRNSNDFRGIPQAWFDTTIAATFRDVLFDGLIENFADLDDAVIAGADLGAVLPLWSGLARDRHIGLRALVVIGNPSEDARAWHAATDLPLTTGALVWARRALEAERNSRALPRRLILRDVLLGDWKTCAANLEAAFDLNAAPPRLADDGDIRALLSPLVPTRAFSPMETLADPILPDIVKELFEILRSMATDPDHGHYDVTLDRIGMALDQACALLGPPLTQAEGARSGLQQTLSDSRKRARSAEMALAKAQDRAARLTLLMRCRATLLPPARPSLTQAVRDRLTRDDKALRLLKDASEFDAAWYLDTYPDVAAGGADPAWHFLRFGAGEGRNPGPAFDTLRYYQANPDVLDDGQIALLHYLRHGRAEGREIFPAEPFPD